tara:strand:+ start:1029 stop:1187 length:159 start_codon:yes stop_codon:yes gene_type:complete
MSLEYNILSVLNNLTSDNLYRQVYAYEIKMLFDMLKEIRSNRLTDDSLKINN